MAISIASLHIDNKCSESHAYDTHQLLTTMKHKKAMIRATRQPGSATPMLTNSEWPESCLTSAGQQSIHVICMHMQYQQLERCHTRGADLNKGILACALVQTFSEGGQQIVPVAVVLASLPPSVLGAERISIAR